MLFRFKNFENVFIPKKMDDRESIRKEMLDKNVKQEAFRIEILKEKGFSQDQLLDVVVEDIFFIWDTYNNDDREGIEHGITGSGNMRGLHTFNYDNGKFEEHVEHYLKTIKCSYIMPAVGVLSLVGFTS